MANDPIITPTGAPAGISALTGDVTASGSGSVAATIAAGAITPAKISTDPGDTFAFPGEVDIATIVKWTSGTTKWQAYVVGNTDLYFRDMTNNRNLMSFSTNGIVQIWQYLDFESAAGIRNCPSIMQGGFSPNAAAMLQSDSTTQGWLAPRMTNTQRDAITSPPEGLMVYSTSDHAYEYWNGSVWKQLATV